jgi:hypothetical protein
MRAQKLFILLVVAVFSLVLASPGITAMDEVKGTVTKIEGSNVTIKDTMGGEKTVAPKNPEALTDLKVGDKVAVKDGILTKDAGMGTSAPSPTTEPGKKY